MSFKVPIVNRPEYIIYMQEGAGLIWGHIDVKKWTPQTAKQIRRDIDILCEMQNGQIVALNEPPGDKKHIKFLHMQGFSFWKSFVDISGVEQFIYSRGK